MSEITLVAEPTQKFDARSIFHSLPHHTACQKKTISSTRAVIPVRALDFVMYNAADIRPTRAFYQKLFGFKRGEEWTESWSEFDTEPLIFALNGLSKTIRPEWNWQGARARPSPSTKCPMPSGNVGSAA